MPPRGVPWESAAWRVKLFGVTAPIWVECYAGYRGEQTPRRFADGHHRVELGELLDCWLAPDHRYFKVRAEDGRVFILRHDVTAGRWELTHQAAPA